MSKGNNKTHNDKFKTKHIIAWTPFAGAGSLMTLNVCWTCPEQPSVTCTLSDKLSTSLSKPS